jgi:predicted DsbA family dithiol-disulfide isomerase
MGGLLPEWNSFNDATNHVSRPIQMGPVWMHAAQISGMPMNTRIWMEDPPASSYPACIAVKCATLQSGEAGEMYLRKLREQIMLGGRNISKQEILNQVAELLYEQSPERFSLQRFNEDIRNETGIDAFRLDMNQVRLHNINRFPTVIIRRPGSSAMMMTGYRDYAGLSSAISQIAPRLEKTRDRYSVDEYVSYWGSITERELEEIKTGKAV